MTIEAQKQFIRDSAIEPVYAPEVHRLATRAHSSHSTRLWVPCAGFMNSEQIAWALHAKLHSTGYPYMAPTVEIDGSFPRVSLFNDYYPALQEIICYSKPEQEHEAKIYALWYAQRMMVSNPPCGVVACVATTDLEIIEVD